MLFKLAIGGLLGFSIALANASEVQVKGTTTAHNWGHYETRESRFKITYLNKDVPWGSTIDMHYGRRCLGKSWYTKYVPLQLNAVSGFVWELTVQIDSAGKDTGYCDEFEFAFAIRLPDGRTVYDNGGLAPLGFYATKIPWERGVEQTLDVERKP